MGTYKGIQGYLVETLSSDPTASENVGKLWYNTTSNTWKVAKEGSGAWSSGGDVNSSKMRGGGCGTQTAAIAYGGADTALTETYNGTAWTEVADLNTARSNIGAAGMAPQTTALGFGGSPPTMGLAVTELYNGTCWSEVADLNTARKSAAAFGVSTAAVMAAGQVPGGTINKAEVEEYNGSCWTEVTNVPQAVREPAGMGIETSGLCVGGYATAAVATTLEYDGTNWSAGGDLNLARYAEGGAGATQTAALAYGGESPAPPTGVIVETELYNGTAWTEVGDLATARGTGAAAGISTAALYVSGVPPTMLATEEWNAPNYEAATVTTS